MSTLSTPRDHNSQNLFVRLGSIEYRAVADLRAYANNPRQHSPRHIQQLGASIRTFGFTIPLLVDGEGHIVAGEARWRAACELGLTHVPVLTADHLTPAQVRAYRIADNRLAEGASWDRKKLAREFEAIIELGEVTIDVTGFETAEIDLLLEGDAPAEHDMDPADEPLEPAEAVSRSGDLWGLDQHRLICGSSRDAQVWQTLMAGETAAMIFSDPPYNVPVNGYVSGTGRHTEFREASGEMTSEQFARFLEEAVGAACEHLKDGGIADLCMDHHHLPELFAAVSKIGLQRLNLCVWNKTNSGMGSLYRSQHELVLVARKGKAPHTNNVQLGRYGRNRSNVWTYAGANAFGRSRDANLADHPTVKPVALVADAIRDVTHTGEIVIDGFMGSGTTLLAAERTKRIGYGIEIEGAYVDVAIRRWETMTGRKARLLATGETLEQVRERRAVETKSCSPVVRHRSRPLAA